MSYGDLPPVFSIDAKTGQQAPFNFGPVAETAVAELDTMQNDAQQQGYSTYLSSLFKCGAVDRETGYGRLWLRGQGDQAVSDEEFFLLIGGFGVPFNEMARLAEYLRRVSGVLGVQDKQGRGLGMIVLDTTNRGIQDRLAKSDIADIRNGNLEALGNPMFSTVERFLGRLGVTQEAKLRIIGYSLGSTLAPAFVESAAAANRDGRRLHTDVGSLTLGALTNPVPRAMRKGQFLANLVQEGARSGYQPGTPEFFTHKLTGLTYCLREAAGAARLNRSIPELVHNNDVMGSIANGAKAFPDMAVNFGIGSDDKMGTVPLMMRGLQTLNNLCDASINALIADGQTHTWARRLDLLGAITGTSMVGFNPEREVAGTVPVLHELKGGV